MAMSNNFDRISRALHFLEKHRDEHPSLDSAAAHVGLSPSHFQRLFSQWAGISPKRFQQYLSVGHARECLAQTRSLLDTTLDVGLSSPGRLHDLFVSVDGVTPGEYKTRGQDLVIHYGVQDSPFGSCLIAGTERGICWLSFHAGEDQASGLEQLKNTWGKAALINSNDESARWRDAVFADNSAGQQATLPLLVKGTNFQIKVWEALLRIPTGMLCSYQDLGRWIGQPKAARAIGSAVGANPIAYLIPCHRVIRAMGSFGQYRWGSARKLAINGWEMARRDQQAA
jgi:AraC family transcriptional regulator of adaptative response/methylated-DNA-[protein]-cysteine methyltransferase